jgi:hypothetical protein
MLSRAFRNRFVELHFDEIPANELVTILHKRCDMPLSYCKKMVAVMTDLQVSLTGINIKSDQLWSSEIIWKSCSGETKSHYKIL